MPPQIVAAKETRMTRRVALSGTLPTASQKFSRRENVRVVESVNPRIREPSRVRSVKKIRAPVKIAVETT